METLKNIRISIKIPGFDLLQINEVTYWTPTDAGGIHVNYLKDGVIRSVTTGPAVPWIIEAEY